MTKLDWISALFGSKFGLKFAEIKSATHRDQY